MAKGQISTALSIWQRALWDGKVYKQAKFGDSFDRVWSNGLRNASR